MDYYNEMKNMKKDSDTFKNLKKMITQILLPLSALSLLFSHSSLLLHSYDYLLSNFTFKVKIFTYTTERNCIFLLCNGILVLIIQSSGLIAKATPVTPGPKASRIDESKQKGVEKEEILEEKEINGGADIEEDFQSCDVEEDDFDDDDGEIDKEELNKKFEEFIKKTKMEIQSA